MLCLACPVATVKCKSQNKYHYSLFCLCAVCGAHSKCRSSGFGGRWKEAALVSSVSCAISL